MHVSSHVTKLLCIPFILQTKLTTQSLHVFVKDGAIIVRKGGSQLTGTQLVIGRRKYNVEEIQEMILGKNKTLLGSQY